MGDNLDSDNPRVDNLKEAYLDRVGPKEDNLTKDILEAHTNYLIDYIEEEDLGSTFKG